MKNIHSVPLQAAALMVGCALSVLAAPAFAASTWSNLGTIVATPTGSGCKTAGAAMGNVADCGAGVITGGTASVTMKADGFSTADGTVAAPTAGTTFAAASVRQYGSDGMGLVNKAENDTNGPNAADNDIGTDALRLTFSKQMTLSQVSIGWNGTDNSTKDSDISILAWVGGGTPGAVNGKTIQAPASAASAGSVATAQAASTLLTSGWKLVKKSNANKFFNDVGATAGAGGTANILTGTGAVGAEALPVYSSYWLISAYNTTFGGNFTSGDDYFKLTGIVGTTNNIPTGKVPEPGSLALVGAAMAGMLALRRRRLVTA